MKKIPPLGLVYNIQHFSLHDGPGIRTTVFLKGCPLSCLWCSNPESKSVRKEYFFHKHKCTGCGVCVHICPNGAHSFKNGKHVIERNNCSLCLNCTANCKMFSLETVGSEMTVVKVMQEVEKDSAFFKLTGGGITLSGGEPVLQYDFISSLLEAAGRKGIHRCIETCGAGKMEHYTELAGKTELFLWDIKDTDEKRHLSNTGASLETVLANLRQVDGSGGKTILRCPVIGGINLNNEHFIKVSRLYKELKHCLGIELLPYHSLGLSKYEILGLKPPDRAYQEPKNKQLVAAYKILESANAPIINRIY